MKIMLLLIGSSQESCLVVLRVYHSVEHLPSTSKAMDVES